MHYIKNEQDNGWLNLDFVAVQKVRDGDQVQQDECGLASDDPPVD